MTRYIWDVVSDNVLMEKDEAGATTAVYTQDPGQFSELISQYRGGKTSVYHYDGQGSTRQLTDENENVTDTYTYDAFGEEVAKTGTTVNPFGYKGAIGYSTNPETGDIYIPWAGQCYEPTIAALLSPNLAGDDTQISPEWFAKVPIDKDVQSCFSLLRNISRVWNFTHPCAADMLNGFLRGNPTPCPARCRKTLSKGFGFIEDCIKNTVQGPLGIGGRVGGCGNPYARHTFNIFGCHDFQGASLGRGLEGGIGREAELGFAYGCVRWDAKVTCGTTCGPIAPSCCCPCTAQCGYVLTFHDVYDFCSTAKSSGPTWCACLLEKKGIGTVYDVKCSATVRAKPKVRQYRYCGPPGPLKQAPCPHTYSSSGSAPITRKKVCEGCEGMYP